MIDDDEGFATWNTGVACPPERTLLVTGLARSGTSMLAGLLHGAGLPMGPTTDDVVFEDVELAEAIESGRPYGTLVRQRDAASPVWGMKRPQLFQTLQNLAAFRAPRLVVVTRDPLAIAQRRQAAESLVELDVLGCARQTSDLLAWAFAQACPLLLISYEKAIRHPQRLVRALFEFAGIDADQAGLAGCVVPESRRYRERTLRRYQGYVDCIDETGTLHGWACDKSAPGMTLTLDVFVDGVAVGQTQANRARPDLLSAGLEHGAYGFALTLPSLGRAATVEVRVANTTHSLTGSGVAAAMLGERLATPAA